MASHGSVPPASPHASFGWDDFGFLGSDRLLELDQGTEQFVQYDREYLLDEILHVLDAAPSELTVVDCGGSAVKVRVNLDLSGVVRKDGQVVSSKVIEGTASLSRQTAEDSALFRAIEYLGHYYSFEVTDFSSRSIAHVKKLISIDDLDEAIKSADNVSVQFDIAVSKGKEFVMQQRERQCCDHFNGPFSDSGRVYGVVIDDISGLMEKLGNKSKFLLEEIDQVKYDRACFEDMMLEQGLFLESEGAIHYVKLPAKESLERLMSYYGLPKAQYTNSVDSFGNAISKCVFEFPHLQGFQFGGRMEKVGKSYSSVEVEEEAAYEALLFIEKHFLTKTCDYNYAKRREIIEAQKKILVMLKKVIDLVEYWRSLFGKFIKATEAKLGLFKFEPTTLFNSGCSAGQIEAYQGICNGLGVLDKHAASFFAACGTNFEVVQKLNWKLIAAEAEMPRI